MTTNLADITKTDLAAEVDRLQSQFNDLGVEAHKLEIELVGARTEISKLQGELTELAARPCLACALAPTHAALVTEARQLLDGAIRHRNAAMTTDSVAQMISNEQWPHFLKAIEQWERKLAVAAQGGI
jgi:chromosome segregation ATPase